MWPADSRRPVRGMAHIVSDVEAVRECPSALPAQGEGLPARQQRWQGVMSTPPTCVTPGSLPSTLWMMGTCEVAEGKALLVGGWVSE